VPIVVADYVLMEYGTGTVRRLWCEMRATIKKVTEDMSGGGFAFNTAISVIMKLNNSCLRAAQDGIQRETLHEDAQKTASLLLSLRATCRELSIPSDDRKTRVERAVSGR
jgi:leucyl-tRNA synthetase